MKAIAIGLVLVCSACGDDGGGTEQVDAPIDTPPCDQQTDPTCCGAPEHDCLGGTCVAGVCQPVELATSSPAGDLAIADGVLYWTQPEARAIERIAVDGTGRAVVVEATPGAPWTVAVAGDTVVWGARGATPTTGAIWRKGAADAAPVMLAADQHEPADIAIDANGVVWVNAGSGISPYVPGELRAVPAAGGTVTTLAASVPRGTAVGLGGNVVFYTAAGTNPDNPADGALTSLPRGGGAPTVFANNRSGPRFLHVGGGHVVWTERGTATAGSARVMRMARSGGLPEVLAMPASPRGIVGDGDVVYWLSGLDLVRTSVPDRQTTVMATFLGHDPTVLVADTEALYVLASAPNGPSTIYRLAK